MEMPCAVHLTPKKDVWDKGRERASDFQASIILASTDEGQTL